MNISIENILSVEKQRGRGSNTLKVTLKDGKVSFVPEVGGNRHYIILKQWLAQGNDIAPAPPKHTPDDRPKSAYITHPNMTIPDDNQAVWRYMSFEQFVSLLSRKALWFSRGNTLKDMDPYEGTLPEPNLKIPPEELLSKIFGSSNIPQTDAKRFFENHRLTQEIMRVNTLINCWNLFDYESHAMWKVYGKGQNCVALKSSVGSLKKSFGPYVDYDVLISEIQYIDYSKESIDESNYLNMLMHKTPFYSSERELRCLIIDDGDNSIFPSGEPYFWASDDTQSLSPGAHVDCSLEELIHEIVIGPESDGWFEELVQQIM
jgi:hypothetical protein